MYNITQKALWQALNSEFSESRVTILNWLIDQMRSKPSIKISIKNISDSVKLHERTVQKCLKEFIEFGFITKKQLYGMYCHSTITLNREIFQYAKYLKYKFASMFRYLSFVYLRPTKKTATPYKEEKVINFNNIHSHVQLSVNLRSKSDKFSLRSNRSSSVGDHLAQLFKKIIPNKRTDTQEWQDIGNGLVRNRKGVVKCIEDVT
jgi:hypothetical protein